MGWIHVPSRPCSQLYLNLEVPVRRGYRKTSTNLRMLDFRKSPVNQLGADDWTLEYLHTKPARLELGCDERPFGRFLFPFPRDRIHGASSGSHAAAALLRRRVFDRRGCADRGITIEAQLQQVLGKPPVLVSASKQQIFFDLTDDKHTVCTPPREMSTNQLMKRAGLAIG